MIKKTNGFTVIELIFIIVLLGSASILFFMQKNSVEVIARDKAQKTAINAMYYALEEVFYPANEYYPQKIDSNNLVSVDPTLFTDPNEIKIGEVGSAYTYSPTNCIDNKCKNYTLKSILSNEAEYIKTNKNNN